MIALTCSIGSAQAPSSQIEAERSVNFVYDVTSFDRDDGLPSNSVRALALDDDGYLWAGTQGGLARFDGFDFDLIRSRNTEALAADRIRSLLFDSTGTLWIGADPGPLIRKRDDSFRAAAPAERLTAVTNLLEAPDGTVWCVGSSIGRWRDGEMTTFDLLGRAESSHLNRLEVDAIGLVWVSVQDGLMRATGDGLEVVDPRATSGLFHGPSGELWVTLPSRRAYRVNDPERTEIEVPFARVYDELSAGADRAMIATSAGLVTLRAPESPGRAFSIERIEGESSDVRSLLAGPRETAWMGSDLSGLRHLKRRRFQPLELPTAPPPSAFLLAQRLDPETVLVGSSSLNQAWTVSPSLEAELIESPSGQPSAVLAATPSRLGVAWVGTPAGLARLEDRVLTHVEGFDRRAPSVVRASDESVWVLQDDLYVEVLANGTRGRATPGLTMPVQGAVAAPGGFLCISADSIVQVDTSTATIKNILDLSGKSPRAIAVDGQGALWVTTYGSGLFRKKADGHVDQWTTSEGLPDDFLGWIDVMPGPHGEASVWLNSNRGFILLAVNALDRFDPKSEDGVDTQLLACGESNGPSGAVFGNGTLLLPTLDGLVAIDRGQLMDGKEPPRVELEWVEIEGERLEMPGTPRALALSKAPRGEADFAFGYSAILFPRSGDVRFQYRLDGHDEGWVDAHRERTARYTNLAPGAYTFHVRARDVGGPWSEAATSASFSVAPLWYQQWFARALIAAGFVALLALAFVLRTRGLMRRSEVLATEIERRQLVEEQLRASEENYVSVLDSAHDGIVMIEADGMIGLANAAMGRMFGYTREEMIGRSATWLGLPDLLDPTNDGVDEESGVIAMREIQEVWQTRTLAIQHKDGTQVEVELSVAEENFRGRPRLVGIVRDVSERRQMTDRLRESEQRFRQLFRTAPTAIIAWQPDRRIVDWNERASELFGWIGEADRTIDSLFAEGGDGDPMAMALHAVLDGSRGTTLVHPTHAAADEERRCRWTFAPVTNASGEVHTVISLVTDVTDDERVQRDMESLRRKLARAEETERSRIARELHDDLSQRLAALAIEMQLLQNGIEERPLEVLRTAIQSVQHGLDEVSTDVHALSRQLHPTVLDDLGLSRALRSECLRRERAAGISIHFVDESERLDVRDEIGLALFRIAQESMQNAIKHAHASEVVVRLAATPDAIELTVSDDGVGFDAEQIADDSGGGLGLASLRERARLIGAELELTSAPGEGTSISVTVVPRTEQSPPALVN